MKSISKRAPRLAATLLGAALISACHDSSSGSTTGPGTNPPNPPNPPTPPTQPADPADAFTSQGVSSAVGGAGGLAQVELFNAPDEPGLERALFWAKDRDDVYDAVPQPVPTGDLVADLVGVPPGCRIYVGLGGRIDPNGEWIPFGPLVSVLVADPIYVDAAADPALADGTSPGTAYADVATAVAGSQGAGDLNLWLAAGDYDASSTTLGDGVFLTGGFMPGFDVEMRDPAASPTVLRGTPGKATLVADAAGGLVVIDGIEFVADGGAAGVRSNRSSLELRAVSAAGFMNSGLRVDNAKALTPERLVVIGSTLRDCGANGLSGRGPWSVELWNSNFESNGVSGVRFDDLVAPDDSEIRLAVSGSRFRKNDDCGLAVDLAPPVVLGSIGARFEVDVRGSRFEENGNDGLLIDEDFEASDLWTADVTILESRARANGHDGVRLDLDGVGTTYVGRLVASANVRDGLAMTSEERPGLATVVGSAFLGNGNYGVRTALGNNVALVSHSVFSGNRAAGGVAFDAPATAVNCVNYLQPIPYRGFDVRADYQQFAINPKPFRRAPVAFSRITSGGGEPVVIAEPLDVFPNSVYELDDDGVSRRGTALSLDELTFDPPYEDDGPGRVTARFFGTTEVDENWTLRVGSPAAGVGLAPTGGAAVDAGPFGLPVAGPPGRPDAFPRVRFHLTRTTPAAALPIDAGQELVLEFDGGSPDPAAFTSDALRAVDESGAELAAGFAIDGDTLRVEAPTGGWPQEFALELFPALASREGDPLAATVRVPFRVESKED